MVPVLVVMPYVFGRVPTDFAAIGFLTAKATILLQRLFGLVARTRSSETFAALTRCPLSHPTVTLHRLKQMQAAHPAEGIDREEDGVGVGVDERRRCR